VNVNECKAFDDGFRVCATDFDSYMKTNLLVPFGMVSSGYLYREGMARPHDNKGKMIGDRKPQDTGQRAACIRHQRIMRNS